MDRIFNGKKQWAVLLLAVLLLAALCAPAWAANSTVSAPSTFKEDAVSISKTQIQSGKVNISNIKMTATASEKFVMIEKAAMEYAAEQDMDISIATNYMQVSFSAAAVVGSEEWKRATNSSPSFNFVVELNDDYTFQNLSTALPAATRTQLGCTTFSPKGVSVEMYLRGGNQSYVYINSLSEDMTLVYDYAVEYRGATTRPVEKSLALVWADIDRKFDSTKTTDKLLPSKVDLTEQTLTAKTPYTCGAYMMVGQTNADNTKTVFAAETTAPGLTGQVNTTGVPAWAAANVALMQQAAVVSDDLSGTDFAAPISRAEFAAYIVRLLEVPSTAAGSNPFKDVTSANPYYSEILAAANAGLVAGRDSVTFAPNASITRQEMAVMFSRALAYAQADTSTDMSKLAAMPDAAKISAWAKNSAAICVNAALIAGKDGGSFAPLDNTSWVEAVVMLSRLSGMLG